MKLISTMLVLYVQYIQCIPLLAGARALAEDRNEAGYSNVLASWGCHIPLIGCAVRCCHVYQHSSSAGFWGGGAAFFVIPGATLVYTKMPADMAHHSSSPTVSEHDVNWVKMLERKIKQRGVEGVLLWLFS